MTITERITKPLLEEAQLGQRLNESVRVPMHSDFSLMLAMLVDDVRMHSQFHLPHDEITEPEISDDSLRRHFSLPDKAPLALTQLAQISQYGQAELAEKGLFSSIHLTNMLKEKPIAFKNDKCHIPSNVLENTSLYCQLKHQKSDAIPKQRKEFDAKAWLQSLQNTVVNSPFQTLTA
ncbi:VC2046/SO_2500 family protein [Thalassotalea sp. 1_MG-2023]|uniref:VC2046/SO_2500 family protein n=1 Tax=Thalassotalea sp. 1_MG-2023 TaxID=3062680 RepID=UPI0026E271F3|nr:VC2046/SO_2500 family protein [Thalassotalea sp. 1_MG-2023]MDO6428383.1 VC2046/SO_2500 family protein [Thalassotalea sp. 1_MG-2023]